MRLAVLSIPLLTLALAGCAAFAPLPDIAAMPHATLTNSHVDVDSDRTDTFRVLEIDGRSVFDGTDVNIKNVEIDQHNLVAAGRHARITVDALAFYGNAARRLFWDPMHVKGTIDFVPVADAAYVVRGSVALEVSSVWIEDAATHVVVGNMVSAPGRGAAAPAQ